MAKQSASRSVIFYKRMIAATLMLIILALSGVSIYLAVSRHSARRELEQTKEELFDYQFEKAQEEAERLRNAPRPERDKPAGERSAPEILADNIIVAHALGSVDERAGLNCQEGFANSYDAGVRVFEADIRMTSDGKLVLRHDWIGGVQEDVDRTSIPTLEEFLSKPIYEHYTPLSFQDLLLLMARYPDICVITDTKFTDTEAVTMQFQEMVDEARQLGLSYLFDRIIVQIYSPEHFTVVDGVYHFPHYIYTLYQDYFGRTVDSFRNKVTFCRENGILGLTLDAEVWDDAYTPVADWQSVKVYVHTVNDVGEAKKLLRSGVDAVYTDSLLPADMEDA